VVRTVDEADRAGFAYGTLPGHPEQGEESFFVERSSGGETTFTIRSFSRPAERFLRFAAPITEFASGIVAQRYLAGLLSYVEAGR
jgi:uncharacterized protein (UPF0548 family)